MISTIVENSRGLLIDTVATDSEVAKKAGNNTQTFKIADATLADEALSKGQLLTEIQAVDGSGSGLDADFLSGLSGYFTIENFMHIQDQKPSGVSGFNIRVLNTILKNSIIGASLSTNAITLPAGTYYIEAQSACYITGMTQLSIYDGTTTLLNGIGTYGDDTNGTGNLTPLVSGSITLNVETTINLRHYFTAGLGSGLGISNSSGNGEVYSDIKIWKVG